VVEKVSVVITCFREGFLLLEALESVRGQSSPPDEIVVVNDASPDETTNGVCRRLEQVGSVRVVWLEKNVGPSAARNAGFAACHGDIFVPLDADDLLPHRAIEQLRLAFAQFPEDGFIHGSYFRQNRPGQDLFVPAVPVTLQSLLRPRRFSMSTNWTLLGTAPLRRWLWENIGGSDTTMGMDDLHDVDFWIRAMALPCSHHAIPQAIYTWRKYLGRNSSHVTPLAWSRIARKHFDVYRRNGLEYRAHQLLLLGSAWVGNDHETRCHRRELRRTLRSGNVHLSTVATLLVPTAAFRFLARHAAKRR
jgi:glycosyltransferase involved in cell wall biosynthesis